MNPNAVPPPSSAHRERNLALKIIGVGDAGINAVSYLASANLPGVTCIAVNTDAQSLAVCGVPHQLQLGARRFRGLGTGGEPELGWAAAEKDLSALRQHCVGADVTLIITGLGGGTGTGASPVLARVARETGALVLAFAVLPFECEGNRRQRQAQEGLVQLRASADSVICLPNQRLLRLLDGHTSAVDTFKYGNRLLGQAVHSLWRLLTRPALIRVDLPDVRQLLKSHPGDSLFATASSQGANRSNDAVDQLLASPLLDPPKRITESSAMLVSIVGGRDLTMAEVNRVVERISRQGEDLHIVLGAAIDDAFTERLEIAGFLLGQARLEEQALATATPALTPPQKPSHDPEESDLDTHALEGSDVRPPTRLVPPAPALTQERAEILMRRQTGSPTRSRKLASKYMQGQLPLEIVSKGRFEKSDPTFHKGEDLDLPTFIRKRVPLN